MVYIELPLGLPIVLDIGALESDLKWVTSSETNRPLPGAGSLVQADTVAAYMSVSGVIAADDPPARIYLGYDPIGIALPSQRIDYRSYGGCSRMTSWCLCRPPRTSQKVVAPWD